jgi:hypothetical protein
MLDSLSSPFFAFVEDSKRKTWRKRKGGRTRLRSSCWDP